MNNLQLLKKSKKIFIFNRYCEKHTSVHGARSIWYDWFINLHSSSWDRSKFSITSLGSWFDHIRSKSKFWGEFVSYFWGTLGRNAMQATGYWLSCAARVLDKSIYKVIGLKYNYRKRALNPRFAFTETNWPQWSLTGTRMMCYSICSTQMSETFYNWLRLLSCTIGIGGIIGKIEFGSQGHLEWHLQKRRRHMREGLIIFSMSWTGGKKRNFDSCSNKYG